MSIFANKMQTPDIIEPLIKDPTLIFFVVLLIILFAPIVMSKLRIPHIIGMVLAGVIIGEHGLNLLQRDIETPGYLRTAHLSGTAYPHLCHVHQHTGL